MAAHSVDCEFRTAHARVPGGAPMHTYQCPYHRPHRQGSQTTSPGRMKARVRDTRPFLIWWSVSAAKGGGPVPGERTGRPFTDA